MENSYGKGAIIFNPASIVYILRSAGMSEEEANKHSNDFITSKGTKIPDLDDIGARLELDNNIPTKKVTDALFKFARL